MYHWGDIDGKGRVLSWTTFHRGYLPAYPAPHTVVAVELDAGLGAGRLASGLQSATPALLFGLRLWASVCLALYVAFWPQFDTRPSGTWGSCQPPDRAQSSGQRAGMARCLGLR
jgi:hypothetical protein